MKTYKTWELLKMAEEVPQREIFKSIEDRRQFKNKDGVVCVFGCGKYRGLFDKDGIALQDSLLNEEWVEVQKHVSFMEAAKAFREGKNVRCEYKGSGTDRQVVDKFYHSDNNPKCMRYDSPAITFYTALNGKWFIEGE